MSCLSSSSQPAQPNWQCKGLSGMCGSKVIPSNWESPSKKEESSLSYPSLRLQKLSKEWNRKYCNRKSIPAFYKICAGQQRLKSPAAPIFILFPWYICAHMHIWATWSFILRSLIYFISFPLLTPKMLFSQGMKAIRTLFPKLFRHRIAFLFKPAQCFFAEGMGWDKEVVPSISSAANISGLWEGEKCKEWNGWPLGCLQVW